MTPKPVNVEGLLFDKDGTLFDFSSTWSAWTLRLMADFADDDPATIERLAEVLMFDLQAETFLPGSPAIAGTNREVAQHIARALPERSVDAIEQHMVLTSADVPLVPPVPLAPLLDGFRARGLALGVMTNDSEYGARAHLGAAGVLERFDFIAGFDSGHGAKPAPDPLLAFARGADLSPGCVAMVGDSTHDLLAGRRAGMQTIGVLTGLANADQLTPYADIVLDDIGQIPAWLDR